MADEKSASPKPGTSRPVGDPISSIKEALAALRFGAIQLTVHEGRLVQMDVTERHRFQS